VAMTGAPFLLLTEAGKLQATAVAGLLFQAGPAIKGQT
jgi:hypothetical protein